MATLEATTWHMTAATRGSGVAVTAVARTAAAAAAIRWRDPQRGWLEVGEAGRLDGGEDRMAVAAAAATRGGGEVASGRASCLARSRATILWWSTSEIGQFQFRAFRIAIGFGCNHSAIM